MLAKNVDEEESAIYTATLQDPDGNHPIVTDLRLTLYDEVTGMIINNRNNQNVLNMNDVTYVAGTGLLTWEILPADNVVLDIARTTETHVAQFVAQYNAAPLRIKPWQLILWVRNLAKVT